MTVRLPKISASRSGSQIEVTLDNFQVDDTWNVYMADDYIAPRELIVSDHDEESYIIEDIDPEKSYMIWVSLNNYPFENSITILSETATGITFETILPATGQIVTKTKSVSWGPDLELDFIEVDGFRLENEPVGPRISIPKNKTL